MLGLTRRSDGIVLLQDFLASSRKDSAGAGWGLNFV